MLILAAAAAPTALEKLKQIPPAFWLKIGIGILALILIILALRKIAQMNKIVLTIILLIVFSTVGFNWIYERNEPTWATPVVEKLAGFFPTKGSYGATQQKTIKP
jgi:hypothetical protein